MNSQCLHCLQTIAMLNEWDVTITDEVPLLAWDGETIQIDANLESMGCEGCYCKIQATITFKGMIRFELVNDFMSFIIEVRSDRPIIDPCNLVPEFLLSTNPM